MTDSVESHPPGLPGWQPGPPAEIPPHPERHAEAHGVNPAPDWPRIGQELEGLHLVAAERPRQMLSRDYYWYSPALSQALDGCMADLVVRPTNEEEVLRIAAVAARHRIALTVRGGGTGNYGQCVPLVGGLVLDATRLNRVLDIAPGRVRVQAGARLHDIERAVRATGQALRIWPSTWRAATLGGFIAGGFGGVGSTAHGVLRDPGNLLRCRVVTVEPEPQVLVLEGDEIQQVHHAYGTNGILTEFEVALSPAVDWLHVIALFPNYRQVLDLGLAAGDGSLHAFLLSAVDARFAPFYTAFGERFPAGQHAMFAMIDPQSMPAFTALVARLGGTVSMALTEHELEAHGLPPAYECAYNHTTLRVLKADRSWTYLQVAYPQPFDPAIVERQMARFGDEVWQHQEFARMHGAPATFGLVLTRWRGLEHQYELIRSIESDGCTIFNPHVMTIEDGGMKTIDPVQIAFKRRADPMGLLNPGKTRGWTPEMARGA
ncbi:MAG: hypothetical protein RI988_164 [Pseudomonadota bacterium]|jgi:FAD/FMN-containing dehydrogenase